MNEPCKDIIYDFKQRTGISLGDVPFIQRIITDNALYESNVIPLHP